MILWEGIEQMKKLLEIKMCLGEGYDTNTVVNKATLRVHGASCRYVLRAQKNVLITQHDDGLWRWSSG